MKEADQQIEELAEKIAEVEIEADEESVPEEEIEEVTKIPDVIEKPKAVEPKVEKPKKKVVPTPKIEPLMPSTESPEEMVSLINIIMIK